MRTCKLPKLHRHEEVEDRLALGLPDAEEGKRDVVGSADGADEENLGRRRSGCGQAGGERQMRGAVGE